MEGCSLRVAVMMMHCEAKLFQLTCVTKITQSNAEMDSSKDNYRNAKMPGHRSILTISEDCSSKWDSRSVSLGEPPHSVILT